MVVNYIPRVTQLDAVSLDIQVEELIKELFLQATKFIEPRYIQPFLPEIELLIRTWIFKHSVYDKKYTFGQEILSVQYSTLNFTKSKLCWYYGYTIGLKYLKERGIFSLTSNTKVQNFIQNVEKIQLFSEVLNFLRFIQSGKHPLLIDFILGLELIGVNQTREDLTDFSWTRELLWHNLIELFGTGISLFNIIGLKQRLSKFLKYVWWNKPVHTFSQPGAPNMTLSTVCACCSNKPVLPHTMGCSHIFCYYCLVANKTMDQDYACPKCYHVGKNVAKLTAS
ncbi:peroxisome biogenesis factor 2 [Bombyx mori]|uniref:RING-type E3 ubiquitin transferase (cysteine targeting) n=1 Tax=Bombyx mori TaxID=7091 RepID=A0A8R2R1W3_BOMMO|nr:peroxisome biogenesis factor 2 [Bombyx mori]XP_037874902.1 peroxisome biogenesis factor 2 [Bombyx mori]